MPDSRLLARLVSRPIPVFRRPPPCASTADPRPDWQQASPAWIRGALAHSQQLPSGGWHVLDASRAIEGQPRRYWVQNRAFVVFRHGSNTVVAPDECPHLGASLSRGHIRDGALVCPWHGLRLGPDGRGAWKPLPTYDDGVLVWVRIDGDEPPTAAPILAPRPALAIDAVVRVEAACDPPDVIANRLDPWHGVHLHPYSFAALRVIDQEPTAVTVRVVYRLLGPLGIEVDARFHCPERRTIVMTVVRGEGEGSVVETHVTPLCTGKSAIIEATLAASDRRGFRAARRLAPIVRAWLKRSSRRLWADDAPYAERLYARRVRHGP